MELYRLGAMEYRFLSIIWENEPVNSTKLVALCNEAFGWKKSTTYTMLKRLQEKGYVKNVDAMVTSLIERSEVLSNESEASYLLTNRKLWISLRKEHTVPWISIPQTDSFPMPAVQ